MVKITSFFFFFSTYTNCSIYIAVPASYLLQLLTKSPHPMGTVSPFPELLRSLVKLCHSQQQGRGLGAPATLWAAEYPASIARKCSSLQPLLIETSISSKQWGQTFLLIATSDNTSSGKFAALTVLHWIGAYISVHRVKQNPGYVVDMDVCAKCPLKIGNVKSSIIFWKTQSVLCFTE